MENETETIALQVDMSEVTEGIAELSDVLEGLTQTAAGIGTTISKAFKPIESSLKGIKTGVEAATQALTDMVGTLSTVKSTGEEASWSITSIFEGIGDGYNGVVRFLDQLGKIDKNSGKVYNVFADMVTAPDMSAFFDSMFPKTTELFSAASEWLNTSVIPVLTGVLGNSGKIAVKLATSTGAWIAETAAKVANTAATWAQVAATTAWSAISTTAAAVTTALGAAMNFLTGPIGLVVLAITAVIAIVALLIANWDTVKETVLTVWENIKQALATAAQWVNENVIQPILDFFTPIVQWFADLFGSIWQTVSDVFYNIGVIITGCWEIIQTAWSLAAQWFDTNIIQPVAGFFIGLWTSISTWAIDAWNAIAEVFIGIGSWIDSNIIQPVSEFFSGLWDGFLSAAEAAWEGVKSVFNTVAEFFGNVFSDAWEGVVKVFSAAGEIFTDIKEGILTAFKSIVNGLITGINSAIAIPFNGINGAIDLIRNIKIFDITPFSGIKTINVPKIPLLAKGAVLPANKPFLAMVGDQRHGTNIEAPLTTIQEAVAMVLSEQLPALMAGFEAVVAEQRATREMIGRIRIGDDVIANAAMRYNRKMAVMRGGW